MLMGFISFLLTVGQKPISKICIPEGIAYTMLPCQKEESIASGSDHCSEQVDTKLYLAYSNFPMQLEVTQIVQVHLISIKIFIIV